MFWGTRLQIFWVNEIELILICVFCIHRAGKTEVLSDDLQAADKRVEFIRLACQNTSKKLSGSLQTQGQDTNAREKRLVSPNITFSPILCIEMV